MNCSNISLGFIILGNAMIMIFLCEHGWKISMHIGTFILYIQHVHTTSY